MTVTPSESIELPTLQQALAVIERCLHVHRPHAHIFRLMDWHEHDGFVSIARPSSWEELRNRIVADDTLRLHFLGGDTYVREAFFPEERDWYLRFYVSDPDDDARLPNGDEDPRDYGDFDITCGEPLANKIALALKAAGIMSACIMAAKTYFDEAAA